MYRNHDCLHNTYTCIRFNNVNISLIANVMCIYRVYQRTRRLLDSLELFARRIQLNATNSSQTKFDQDLIKIQLEEMPLSEFSGHAFTPDLGDMAEFFKNDTNENPLMGVTISLPEALASYIQQSRNSSSTGSGSPPPAESLRVINFVLLRDTFFVSNEVEDDFGGRQLGNVFIAASLSFPEQVRDLMEPVVIKFTQTEVSCTIWFDRWILSLLILFPALNFVMIIVTILYYGLVYVQLHCVVAFFL